MAALVLLALAIGARGAAAEPPPRIVVALVYDSAGVPHLVHETELILTFANEPNCPPPHFHGRFEPAVIATDGATIPDPSQTACGFGIVLPFFSIYVVGGDGDGDGLPDADELALGLNPNSVDSDGDGLPDPLEDLDDDGLRTDDEIHLHGTDPLNATSVTPGVLDSVQVALDETGQDFYKIPLLVNILARSGPDGATDPASSADPFLVRDAIAKASEILKQAKVMFFPRFVSITPEQNMAFDANGDGVLEKPPFLVDGTEIGDAFDQGEKEVDARLNGKGMKLVVARQVGERFDTFGDNGGMGSDGRRAVLLSMNPGGLVGDANKLGAVIAHEVLHGLGAPHSEDLQNPTTLEVSPLNLMTGGGGGVFEARMAAVMAADSVSILQLSPRQIAALHDSKLLARVGYKGTKKSPGRLVEQELGFASDDRGDATAGSPAHLDLRGASVASDEDSDLLDLAVDVYGLLPAADPVSVGFRFRIDTDADGVTERSVDLLVVRETQDGPLQLGAMLNDPSFLTLNQPLLPPTLEVVRVIAAEEPFSTDDPAGTRLRIAVPKALLPFTADAIPISVQAIEGTPGVTGAPVRDTLGPFELDRTFTAGFPRLVLTQETAGPGDPVPFTITGLTPGAAFDLLVDETVVLSGTLDGAGGFADMTTWPDGIMPGFHFLLAVDASGAFAFNGIDATAPPGDLDFDGVVDEDDRDVLLGAFGLTPDDAGFVPAADLDGDGQITFVDYQLWLAIFDAASQPDAEPESACGLPALETLIVLAALRAARRRRGAR